MAIAVTRLTATFPGETSTGYAEACQTSLGRVIIGFPATTDLGDGTQQWSEEPVADHAYIQARLNAISKTNKNRSYQGGAVWILARSNGSGRFGLFVS